MSRRPCPCGTLGCPWEQIEPDPLTEAWWAHWFDVYMHEYSLERHAPVLGFLGIDAAKLREPVPSRPEVELTVDVSRLGEDLVLSSDDASVYGTSGELDPRGYWAPDVG